MRNWLKICWEIDLKNKIKERNWPKKNFKQDWNWPKICWEIDPKICCKNWPKNLKRREIDQKYAGKIDPKIKQGWEIDQKYAEKLT